MMSTDWASFVHVSYLGHKIIGFTLIKSTIGRDKRLEALLIVLSDPVAQLSLVIVISSIRSCIQPFVAAFVSFVVTSRELVNFRNTVRQLQIFFWPSGPRRLDISPM